MAFIDVAWQWAGRLALNGGRFAMAWGFLQMAKLMMLSCFVAACLCIAEHSAARRGGSAWVELPCLPGTRPHPGHNRLPMAVSLSPKSRRVVQAVLY
jgi:hypothetical protein